MAQVRIRYDFLLSIFNESEQEALREEYAAMKNKEGAWLGAQIDELTSSIDVPIEIARAFSWSHSIRGPEFWREVCQRHAAIRDAAVEARMRAAAQESVEILKKHKAELAEHNQRVTEGKVSVEEAIKFEAYEAAEREKNQHHHAQRKAEVLKAREARPIDEEPELDAASDS